MNFSPSNILCSTYMCLEWVGGGCGVNSDHPVLESGISQPRASMFVFFCGGKPGPGQWFQASHIVCLLPCWPHRCPTVEVTREAFSAGHFKSFWIPPCDSPHTHIQAAACSWVPRSQGSRQEAQSHTRWSRFG